MAIKGTTEILLTDVNTGKIEQYKNENMVTKAIPEIFNNNIEGMLFTVQGSGTTNFTDNILPLCRNAIGGILMFQDALVEDEDNIFAPSSNQVTGYASNDVNSTANQMRGSLNLTESTKLENGYKFVWDFTTSQGNGTISALALTHKFGGIGYFGDTYNMSSKQLRMKNVSLSGSGIRANYYLDVVEVNFEGNYMYSISMDTSNQVVIRKIRKCFRQIGLNFTLQDDGDQVLDTQTLVPTTFINASTSNGYFEFHDGEDGYWYGFMGSSNSSGSATVKWIKIKKSDFSFSEGTWTLPNTLIYQLGYRSGYGGSPIRYVQSIMRNGYLYMMHYNRTGMYKINANNAADITWIPFGFTTNFSGGSNYGYTYIWKLGDRIIGSDFNILADDTIIKTTNWTSFDYVCTPMFQYGPYCLVFGRYAYSSNYSTYKNIWLMTPYLATINNLSTSVIKTADKTMKITYTVTEE